MTAPDSERWAIVGGGILGMTLALRLAQRGLSVTPDRGAPTSSAASPAPGAWAT